MIDPESGSVARLPALQTMLRDLRECHADTRETCGVHDRPQWTCGFCLHNMLAKLDNALAAAQERPQPSQMESLLAIAFERLRWANSQCGACGTRYRLCRGCETGTLPALGRSFKAPASVDQCGGHSEVPCPPTCLVEQALAAGRARIVAPPELSEMAEQFTRMASACIPGGEGEQAFKFCAEKVGLAAGRPLAPQRTENKEDVSRVSTSCPQSSAGSTAPSDGGLSMNVLFVDFDGVLNTSKTWGARPLHTEALDADKVQRLSQLSVTLDANVVVSSSWRYLFGLDDFRNMLMRKGFQNANRIIGMTPPATTGRRGTEVIAWLAEHPVKAFAILDDMGLDSFEGLGRHLVQVDCVRGLTDQDCEMVRRAFSDQLRVEPQSINAVDPQRGVVDERPRAGRLPHESQEDTP